MIIRWRLNVFKNTRVLSYPEHHQMMQVRKKYTECVLAKQRGITLLPLWFQFVGEQDNTRLVSFETLLDTQSRDFYHGTLIEKFKATRGKIASALQHVVMTIGVYQRNKIQTCYFKRGFSNDPITLVCAAMIDFLVEFSRKYDYTQQDLTYCLHWSQFIASINTPDPEFIFLEDTQAFRQLLAYVYMRLMIGDEVQQIPSVVALVRSEMEARKSKELLKELTEQLETIIYQSIELQAVIFTERAVPELLSYHAINEQLPCNRALLLTTNVGFWVLQLYKSIVGILEHPKQTPEYAFLYQSEQNCWHARVPLSKRLLNVAPDFITHHPTLMNDYFKLHALIERLATLLTIGDLAKKLTGEGGDLLVTFFTQGAINQFTHDAKALLTEAHATLLRLITTLTLEKTTLIAKGQWKALPPNWETNFNRAQKLYDMQLSTALEQALSSVRTLQQYLQQRQLHPEAYLQVVMSEAQRFTQVVQQTHLALKRLGLVHTITPKQRQQMILPRQRPSLGNHRSAAREAFCALPFFRLCMRPSL